MSKAFQRHANRLFALYTLSGIAYLSALLILAVKVLPGSLMQLLFFIDSLLRNTGMNILNSAFAESMLTGGIVLYLLFVAVRGLIKSMQQYNKSIAFIGGIKGTNTIHSITYISDSTLHNIFTAGFLNPRIFASEPLLARLSESQKNAVLLHEESHRVDRDPLRNYIVTLFNNMLPDFPLKSYFLDIYQNTIELKCDEYAENHLNGDKKSLVQALYLLAKDKIANGLTNDYVVQYFNTHIERIPVLIGSQQVSFKTTTSLVAILPLLAISFLVSVYSLKFYNCSHLVECIEVFVSNVARNKSDMLCEVHTDNTETDCISK